MVRWEEMIGGEDMFGHFVAKFQDGLEFRLFGQDYFGDRVEFNRHHHENLAEFSLEVCARKRPIFVYSSYEEKVIEFNANEEFDAWYKEYQSPFVDFGFSDLTTIEKIEKEVMERAKAIDKLFIEGIDFLQITSTEPLFRHYYRRYNELIRASKMGVKSLEVLLTNSSLDRGELEKFKEVFASPLLKIDEYETLEFYTRTAEKTISTEEMTELLLKHHKLFQQKFYGDEKDIKRWYYKESEYEILGSILENELKYSIESGQLSNELLIRDETMKSWVKASSINGLFSSEFKSNEADVPKNIGIYIFIGIVFLLWLFSNPSIASTFGFFFGGLLFYYKYISRWRRDEDEKES